MKSLFKFKWGMLPLIAGVLMSGNSHSQSYSLNMDGYAFATSSCNNFKGNYANGWRPTHGSPNSIFNPKKAKLVAQEAFPYVKSEGIFYDLSNQAFMFNSGYEYKVTVSYQCSDPSNVTLKLFGLKNAPNEQSDASCLEQTVPSLSNKQGIYTSGNFLGGTYSGQVKTIEATFIPNSTYRYLWLYSDILGNFGTNNRHTIYVTSVQIQRLGSASSGPTCQHSTIPANRRFQLHAEANEIQDAVWLKWNEVHENARYGVNYRKSGNQDWVALGAGVKEYVKLDGLEDRKSVV